MSDEKRNYPEVTRIEVIDNYGRAFVRYYAFPQATIMLQDDGRTLKIFAGTPLDKPPVYEWDPL